MLEFNRTLTAYICPEVKTSERFNEWISKFAKYAGDGFTASEALGGWMGADGNFVTEKIIRFTVWEPALDAVKGLLETLDLLRETEHQEAVSVEIDRKPYVCFSSSDIQSLIDKYTQDGESL